MSDERLARLAAGGDRAAFATIFDRYHQRLFSYCASILRNRDDAADAVQSTMLRAMRALEGEEREIAVRPWLYRIAHNEAIELLRRPRTEPDSGAEVVTVSDVEADAAVRAHLRAILEDIRRLPDRQRSALVMRELSGLSYEEIGAALMSSEAGAKQAVYDARQALHELAKGRDTDCESIRRKLSDGDRRVFRGRVVRGHLTACTDCRTWQAELAARETSWAAFSPVMPAVAATAVHGAIGGGAGAGAGAAAAGSVAGASATAPAIATVAVAVVLGAGAVGVHEMKKDADVPKPPARAQMSPATSASTPAARHGSRKQSEPMRRASTRRAADRRAAKERAETRARARRARARDRRAARDRARANDSRPGAGSTALGGTPVGAGGGQAGGGGSGVRSWVGGDRHAGPHPGGGPIRQTVDGTRDAVEGTVAEVQQSLPVPTPEVRLPHLHPRR